MPGVSSRAPVNATDGFGKVYLKFRVKEKPRTHYLGTIIYSLFFSLMFFVFAWKRPYLKDNILMPIIRGGFGVLENILGVYYRSGSAYVFTRDENGISFISGENLSSMSIKQGYVHSIDRFVQMELYRRTAQGRLSELFGENSIEVDNLALSLNFLKSAQHDHDSLDTVDKSILDAYCEGVNKYIGELTSMPSWALPLEYATIFEVSFTTLQPLQIEEWKPVHSLTIMRLLNYEWSSGWEDQVIALLAGKSGRPVVREVGSHLLPSLGGHVFAVSGEHSASGGALLAGSVQSRASSSGRWYLNALETPTVRVSGASVPGVPLVFMGRNNNISWAFTSSSVTEELVIPFTEDSVVTERSEVIKVRGKVANNETYVSLKVKELVSDDKTQGALPLVSSVGSPHIRARLNTALSSEMALSSPALLQPVNLQFLLGVATAESWNEFLTATSSVRSVALNVVYVDDDNNVGAVTTGSSGSAVLNPPSGYVCASSGVDLTAEESRLERFLREAVSGGQKVDSSLAEAFLLDVHSPSSLRLGSLVAACVADPAKFPSSEVQEKVALAKALVEGFDGRYSQDSIAPVLLEALRVSLFTRLASYRSELVLLASQTAVIRRQTASHRRRSSALLDVVEQLSASERDRVVVPALFEAVSWCEEHFGKASDKWRWGVAHKAQYLHPSVPGWYLADNVFSRGPYPLGGAADSVFLSDNQAADDSQRLINNDELFVTKDAFVSSLRLLVDMADTDRFHATVSTGQSSSIGSKWYGVKSLKEWDKKWRTVCFSASCLVAGSTRSQYCSAKNDASRFLNSGCESKTNEL